MSDNAASSHSSYPQSVGGTSGERTKSTSTSRGSVSKGLAGNPITISSDKSTSASKGSGPKSPNKTTSSGSRGSVSKSPKTTSSSGRGSIAKSSDKSVKTTASDRILLGQTPHRPASVSVTVSKGDGSGKTSSACAGKSSSGSGGSTSKSSDKPRKTPSQKPAAHDSKVFKRGPGRGLAVNNQPLRRATRRRRVPVRFGVDEYIEGVKGRRY